MARFSLVDQAIDMTSIPLSDTEARNVGLCFVPLWAFWVMLVFQILAYPVLAIIAERYLHGLNFKRRTLSDTAAGGVAVRTVSLTKAYPTIWYKKWFGIDDGTGLVALDKLDLVAQNNQILCLLGVNGAGKSTALDLLSGFHTPTSGEMVINARPSQLGICPQKNILFDRLTVLEHVRFWSQLKGGREDLTALHTLIEACGLSVKIHSQARTLSGGQKRKLQLACMFVGETKICMMDEVTTGLVSLPRGFPSQVSPLSCLLAQVDTN